ncbi:MAG: App1 family protein [Campylobacteraceae bacterium]|jgi:hypothetical protein|nr:App1 family protein [Campylobacteraceae bacterium]
MCKIKFLILIISIFTSLKASELKSDEYVMFIPSTAYNVDNKTIIVEINAYVYEKERRLGATTALASLLDIDIDTLNKTEKQRLYNRSALFRIDYESGKEFFIKFTDGSLVKMPKTNSGKGSIKVKLEKPLKREIDFEVYKPKHKANIQKSFALYPADEGVSAVFDIDDTIKISNVLDKKALLVNVFLNEYKTVDGIQKIFKHVQNLRADAYHYVSASPVQLYPVLKDFFEKESIPKGTFHLRDATDLNNFIPNKNTTIKHKKENIEKLFKVYPKRKFILIGDSGENDPEIYADLQRKYPGKILQIIIHDLENSNGTSLRFQKSFEGIDKNKLMFF